VQASKADVERLAREAEGNQTAPAQIGEINPQAATPDVRSAGKLARAVAWWLRHLFPDGQPPGKSDKVLSEDVRTAAGQKLGVFSSTTLKRAKRLAWPPRGTGPDRAKPGQPSQ
jgi:hypothetical protein